MKHPIELAFVRLQKEFPHHSSYIIFARSIHGRAYEKGLVLRYARRLIEKTDYEGVNFQSLAENLVKSTYHPPKYGSVEPPRKLDLLQFEARR